MPIYIVVTLFILHAGATLASCYMVDYCRNNLLPTTR